MSCRENGSRIRQNGKKVFRIEKERKCRCMETQTQYGDAVPRGIESAVDFAKLFRDRMGHGCFLASKYHEHVMYC